MDSHPDKSYLCSQGFSRINFIVNVVVVFPLLKAEVKQADFLGYLFWELGLHFFLKSSQQERTQHLVETTDDQYSLLFIQLNLRKTKKKKHNVYNPYKN